MMVTYDVRDMNVEPVGPAWASGPWLHIRNGFQRRKEAEQEKTLAFGRAATPARRCQKGELQNLWFVATTRWFCLGPKMMKRGLA